MQTGQHQHTQIIAFTKSHKTHQRNMYTRLPPDPKGGDTHIVFLLQTQREERSVEPFRVGACLCICLRAYVIFSVLRTGGASSFVCNQRAGGARWARL